MDVVASVSCPRGTLFRTEVDTLGTLAFKVTLTPLLIAAASVAQRRWGGTVGGLIAGLPLTSAPVSVFLALEHGPAFAAQAATATMLGVNAMSAFCVAYATASVRLRAWSSAVAGLLVCLAATLLASHVPQQVGIAALITFPALVLLVLSIGRPSDTDRRRADPPWWDVPARMVVATLVVVLVTAAASWLGATWSGLLSTLPVYALVMGMFSHAHAGAHAAQTFLRGVTVGALGAAAFLLAVAVLVERASLLATYSAAVVASLAVAGASQAIFAVRSGPHR